jgi:hypothetical protein
MSETVLHILFLGLGVIVGFLIGRAYVITNAEIKILREQLLGRQDRRKPYRGVGARPKKPDTPRIEEPHE